MAQNETRKECEARWCQSARDSTCGSADDLAASDPTNASGNGYNASVNAAVVAHKLFPSHFVWYACLMDTCDLHRL